MNRVHLRKSLKEDSPRLIRGESIQRFFTYSTFSPIKYVKPINRVILRILLFGVLLGRKRKLRISDNLLMNKGYNLRLGSLWADAFRGHGLSFCSVSVKSLQ